MSINVKHTSFLADKNKTDLTEFDLFDRIINVKIITANGNEYVIRSDYEIAYSVAPAELASTPLNSVKPVKYIIRKCGLKPSIKVQYECLTANVGASIKLYLNNFYVLTPDGKCLKNFTFGEDKIVKVAIYMGYFGQFRKTYTYKDSAGGTHYRAPKTIAEYKDLKAVNGISCITINTVVMATTEALPPDYTLCLSGFVSNLFSAPLLKSSETNYDSIKDKAVLSTEKASSMEKFFFEVITKHFVKNELNRRTEELTDEEAKLKGVQVFTSDGIDKLKTNFKKLKDSEGNEVEAKMYISSGINIAQTMKNIMTALRDDIEYAVTNNGDLLVFLREEISNNTDEESVNTDKLHDIFLKKGAYEENVFSSHYGNKLPAVTSINIDSLTTIVCPFFAFLEPFQRIEFRSRYSLTSMTGYIADFASVAYYFNVIRMSVSFATVDDLNEVTIIANISDYKGE